MGKKILSLFLMMMSCVALATQSDYDKQFDTSANLLENPGFESGLAKWFVVNGATRALASSGDIGYGAAALTMSTTSTNDAIKSSALTLPRMMYGRNCYAVVHYKTTASDYKLEVYNGSDVLQATTSLAANSTYGRGTLAFTCPTSGSIYLSVRANANTLADITLDEAFLGLSIVDAIALSDPMTTRGDLIYRNTSNVTARLPVGASSTVLQSDGTDPSYSKIVNAHVDAAAAIAFSKLASMGAGDAIVGNGSGVPTSQTLNGDVTMNSGATVTIATGAVTSGKILDDTIVNVDINASAAIAGSKIVSASDTVAGVVGIASTTQKFQGPKQFEDMFVTKDATGGSVTIASGYSAMLVNLTISSGDTVTANGTLLVHGIISGSGTLNGSGTVSSF